MIIHNSADPGPPMLGANSNVETFIEDHKRRADLDPCAPPFDDLRFVDGVVVDFVNMHVGTYVCAHV